MADMKFFKVWFSEVQQFFFFFDKLHIFAVFYLLTNFNSWRLINKNVEWFLLMCKEYTSNRPTNISRNHPTFCF